MSGKKKISSFNLILIVSIVCAAVITVAAILSFIKVKDPEKDTSSVNTTSAVSSEPSFTSDTSSETVSDVSDTPSKDESTSSTSSASSKKDTSSNSSKKSTSSNTVSLTSSFSEITDYPIPDGSKVCYLTFDDGPSSKVTPRILDTLKKYDVKATFFVLGTGKLDILKRYIEEGHTIGLHSNTHEYDIYDSSNAYFTDLQAISDKVYAATGIRSNIVRFPGGSSNKVSIKHCKGIMTKLTKEVEEKGYIYIDWNVTSGDAVSGHTATKSEIVNNVLKGATDSKGNPKDSICVLMHDTNSKTATADALPEIIEGLKKMGYVFAPITSSSPTFHHHLNN